MQKQPIIDTLRPHCKAIPSRKRIMKKIDARLMVLASTAFAVSVALSACGDSDISPHVAMSADVPAKDAAKPADDISLARNDPPDTLLGNEPTGAGMPSLPSPTAASTVLSASEKQFLVDAAANTQYELAVAQIAKDKAADSAVKSYAAMLVGDHSESQTKLQLLAQRRQVALPSKLPADKQRVVDQLNRASGKDFDRQFIQTVGLRDHKADIELFEKASRDAKDNEVREFAASALPTLRAHLSAAQNLPPSVSSL